MNEYFRSTEQTEAHDASVIVYWGEPFDRPNVLIGVIPHERPICESCGDNRDPMLTLAFDMDDSIAEAFELAVARWREHAETAARERPTDPDENGRPDDENVGPCARCGHDPACGFASVDGDWLCHDDDHSCYFEDSVDRATNGRSDT